MAHGGSEEWNAAVEKAVEPLRSFCPTAIAFGMADRESLAGALRDLESRGVSRIVVARLFVSGLSFLEQTEYFLGLRDDPPDYFLLHHASSGGHGSGESGQAHHSIVPSSEHPMEPIPTTSSLALTPHGLYDADEIGEIVVERVRTLSREPSRESVLVLAHGEGDDDVNSEWVQQIERITRGIQAIGPFSAVRVETLREDWSDKRKPAEKRIRQFVLEGDKKGDVLVIPFRLFGFGPYRKVLEGLEYRADGVGLLPHQEVTNWLMREASDCFASQGWENPFKAGSGSAEAQQ